eukprot:124620_1
MDIPNILFYFFLHTVLPNHINIFTMSSLPDSVISDFVSGDAPRQLRALKRFAKFSYEYDTTDDIIKKHLVGRLLQLCDNSDNNDIKQRSWALLKRVIVFKAAVQQAIDHNGLSIFCDFSSNTYCHERVMCLSYVVQHHKPSFIQHIYRIVNALIDVFHLKVTLDRSEHFSLCTLAIKHWKSLSIKQTANLIQILQRIPDTIIATMSRTQCHSQSYLDNIILYMQKQWEMLCFGFIKEATHIPKGIMVLCTQYLAPKNCILEQLTRKASRGAIHLRDATFPEMIFPSRMVVQSAVNQNHVWPVSIQCALEVIANIECDDILTDLIARYNLAQILTDVLKHGAVGNKILALWIASNCCTVSSHVLQRIIDCGIIQICIANIRKEDHLELVKESLWCLCNATSGANVHQKEYMVKNNAIHAISEFVTIYNQKYKAVLAGLEALENLLAIKGKVNIQFVGETELKSAMGLYLNANEHVPQQIIERCQMIMSLVC